MSTVLDLITESLEEIGARAAGDVLDANDQAKALTVLKRMVAASNINRGNIATLRHDLWTLVAGTQTYTIGIDPATIPVVAAFVGPRPIKIERANVLVTAGGTTEHRKLNLLDTDQWAAKGILSTQTTPEDLYNDAAYPLSTYYFDPIPDAPYVIETWTWQQFAQSLVTDILAIPPGYQTYWTLGLALQLCAPFGRTAAPTTIKFYEDAKAEVMSLNCPSPRIRSDGDLGSEYSTFNWRTGIGTWNND